MNNNVDELARSSSIVPLSYIDSNFLSTNVSNLAFRSIKEKTLAENILKKLTDVIYELVFIYNFNLRKKNSSVSFPKWVFARVAAIKCISDILVKFVPENFDFSTIIDRF